MSFFNRKKEQEKFKATLTYGTDVLSLYEEAKRVEREVKVWRDRIFSSDEWKKKEELEKQQRAIEETYEKAIGVKYGFDPTDMGTHFHLRDYMKNYNKCEKSPFGYHATVWVGEDRENTCVFCKEDL